MTFILQSCINQDYYHEKVLYLIYLGDFNVYNNQWLRFSQIDSDLQVEEAKFFSILNDQEQLI